jgi:hypothetical protein
VASEFKVECLPLKTLGVSAAKMACNEALRHAEKLFEKLTFG